MKEKKYTESIYRCLECGKRFAKVVLEELNANKSHAYAECVCGYDFFEGIKPVRFFMR